MSTTTLQPVGRLVAGLRSAIDDHADRSTTAQHVAGQPRAHLPGPNILTPAQGLGSPDRAYTAAVDLSADFDADQWFGMDVFLRDGETIYRCPSTTSRGAKELGTGSSVRRSDDCTPEELAGGRS
jgi:hypothetical protein